MKNITKEAAMKTKKSIKALLAGLALFAVMVFLWINVFPNKQQIRAEQIIFSYMISKKMYILPGTEQYKHFMEAIIWKEHPELNRVSDFIKNEDEVDDVIRYALKYSGYDEIYGGRIFPEVKEAVVPTPNDWEKTAEQIILSYMASEGMDIEPGTEEYQMFMRKIIWREVPELNRISNFIKNEEEIRYVDNYAWIYSGYEEAYGNNGTPEPEVKEAPLIVLSAIPMSTPTP